MCEWVPETTTGRAAPYRPMRSCIIPATTRAPADSIHIRRRAVAQIRVEDPGRISGAGPDPRDFDERSRRENAPARRGRRKRERDRRPARHAEIGEIDRRARRAKGIAQSAPPPGDRCARCAPATITPARQYAASPSRLYSDVMRSPRSRSLVRSHSSKRVPPRASVPDERSDATTLALC